MTTSSHVLARKYRPLVFADLIGQDALVQTITNAIATGRLAHAYMLTGIRGVGKTTSARIIAKGLNCIGEDGKGGMTPNPCGKCRHCLDITNDAHIDVIEIDAASNTGVEQAREIIEGAKYNPVSARFKVYIIDEVHMLSKSAFNALLKTLEEPPARVKFIFATTEIRKVPVTILSRCQRFDLKRVDDKLLSKLLKEIGEKEKISAEENALKLIARIGDGSVRDALSFLDQAMTQLDGNVTAGGVRKILGIVDRSILFELYESLMGGNVASALDILAAQYEAGNEPLAIIQDLLDLTHQLTRMKINPDVLKDAVLSQIEREKGAALSTQLSMGALTSAWQLLLKGVQEVKFADNPLKALEMVLVRLAYLS
ncbi:MAG: DNA polymerase III subunit gamma/tau, partial [Lactobacillales bacterium]|nr:DNA polymerase III subunit gamma/tau [Lactobacillales bacterium]